MRLNRLEVLVLLSVIGSVLVGCSKESNPLISKNGPPVISKLTANLAVVAVGDTTILACAASDPDADSIVYEWSSEVDSAIGGNSSIVSWVVPDVEGTYAVTCRVEDGNGGLDAEDIIVAVRSSMYQAYLDAVADAEIAEENEIYDKLVAVVESNGELVWKGVGDGSRLLVLTWTRYDTYNDLVGDTLTAWWGNTWVTAVPELREFMSASMVPEEKLTRRLEQLLGLPPDNGNTWFVELWVEPGDLFRPTPDPEITDTAAELDFPEGTSQDHIGWFNDNFSYGEDGYPWTRLGYTFDWGNPESDVGLSEFVIGQGSNVEVHSVSATKDYCEQYSEFQRVCILWE